MRVYLSDHKSVPVKTLADARRVVQDYIGKKELGSTAWYRGDDGGLSRAGDVLDDAMEHIAHVSYNGRVWEPGPPGELTTEIIVPDHH